MAVISSNIMHKFEQCSLHILRLHQAKVICTALETQDPKAKADISEDT
jgi:hypothetical protein